MLCQMFKLLMQTTTIFMLIQLLWELIDIARKKQSEKVITFDCGWDICVESCRWNGLSVGGNFHCDMKQYEKYKVHFYSEQSV